MKDSWKRCEKCSVGSQYGEVPEKCSKQKNGFEQILIQMKLSKLFF